MHMAHARRQQHARICVRDGRYTRLAARGLEPTMTYDTPTEKDTDSPPAYEQVENAEILDVSEQRLRQMVRPEMLQTYPHRDPERLRKLYDNKETVKQMGPELDCAPDTVSKWLNVYGIRTKRTANYPDFVIEAMNAEGSA